MTAGASPVVLTIRQIARADLHVLLVGRVEIGRDCDGVIVADPQASRRHAEFRLVDGRVRVVDFDSANGTRRNGRRIEGTAGLEVGDVVGIGTTEIMVGSHLGDIDVVAEDRSVDRPKTSVELLAEEIEPHAVASAVRSEGTFTIAFSDIEGSTAYATSVGDAAWMDVLDRHNEIIRGQLRSAGGREVKSVGDGFMLSFDSARRSVEFAIAVQRELERERAANPAWTVHVRIGIHSGEAIATSDGDLFGRHVIIAARVADKANGGEILVTSLVRELTTGRDEFTFGPASVTPLKGIGDQVVHDVKWVAT